MGPARRRAASVAAAIFLGGITAALSFGACGGESEAVESLCDPGTDIFCRCPGGDPGTKRCNDQGTAFSECDNCSEREDPGGQGGGTVDPTGGGGNPDGAPLLRPCTTDGECQSGLCEFSYCTKQCAKVSDCEFPASECVKQAGVQVCMPVCNSALDCEPFGAPPSQCGFATAVDNWGVTVCANFGAEHRLVPNDSDCPPFDHEKCNLGYANREKVCTAEGLCQFGCFTASDCPLNEKCSGNGDTLGECG